MTRPLMPGSEPVQLKYAQPKAPAQRLDAPPPTIPGPDCTCYPVGKPPGLLRGVYDFPTGTHDSNLNGRVRWLDPGTGKVYDSGGRRQWTFVPTGDPDLWVDEHRPSYKWRALPVIATTPPIYFNWV